MPSKRLINLIIGALIVGFSSAAIFFSNDQAKLASPFDKEFDRESAASSLGDVYEEEVLGQSMLVSEEPSLSFAPEDITEESLDAETEQVEESGYKVVKVVDGDTLDVDIDGKIERLRLIGIDTPETVDPRKSVQCYGNEASSKAKELLDGKLVSLESDETQGDRDKYRRLLRYVFLPDGTNFNLFMIAEGYAHEYTYQNPYKYQYDFKEAERSAREASIGLWNPNACPS